ncbi:MAG: nuclear transport factor 2 family protein [Sphingomonadaceae bacterium]|jgi:3-phenylpropionate/cinnamic acid dioxygenase small subunit
MASPAFEDWLAICNLKAAYCRLLDTKDWAAWRELFIADVHVDTTGSGGTVTDDLETYASATAQSLEHAKTAHQVHSPEIEIDGDEARATWAMQDRVVWDGRSLTGYGHYRETYVRTADGWKIASLVLTRLHMDMDGFGG